MEVLLFLIGLAVIGTIGWIFSGPCESRTQTQEMAANERRMHERLAREKLEKENV